MTNTTDQIPTVDVPALLEFIADMLAADLPGMIYGAPGIGKSAVVGQAADSHRYAMLDRRLGYLLPENIGPILYPIAAEQRVQAFTPALIAEVRKLREESGKPVLVFLDEITVASRETMSVALEFILEKRINGERAPDDTRILAAGNRPNDTPAAIYLDAPIRSRMASVLFAPTLADLAAYLSTAFPKAPLAAAVASFLTTPAAGQIAAKTLHADGIAPIWTPRGTVRAIAAMLPLVKGKGIGDIIENPRAMRIMESLTGVEFSAKFSAFAVIADQVTSAADILAKPKRAKLPTTQEAIIAQLTAIHNELINRQYDGASVDSFLEYLDRFDRADAVRVWVMTLRTDAMTALTRTIRGKRVMQALSVSIDDTSDLQQARG